MDDPLVSCPFNPAHSCKQSRIQKHLIKCRKNHPESKLEPCPYNATEYIHPDELIEHLKVCKKAKLLEGQKYNAELLQENYLDAPFHVPKRKVEPEDFEGQEISVNDYDTRILERSISQMSMMSMASTKSLGIGSDNATPSFTSPLHLQSRTSVDPSRASSLRSVGRGHAMAGLISVLQQIDEMDYSKYEIRSVAADKSEEPDTEFAPPSKFESVRQGNISLFDCKPKQDESNFEDCSSEEELEACDNVSLCSSKSTIIENTPRWCDSVSPEPARLCSDSEDECNSENHISKTDSNDVAVTFRANSPCESTISINCISVCSGDSQNTYSNDYESSSSRSTFFSLIEENMLQNDCMVKKMEQNKKHQNFSRTRPNYLGRNHSFRNRETSYEPAGAQPPSAAGRGSALNSFHNSSDQSNFSNNRPRFNQNSYQNSPPQKQYRQRPYSNQSNQSKGRGSVNQFHSYGGGDSHSELDLVSPGPQRPYSNQSNHNSYTNQSRGRGSVNQVDSVGSDSCTQMNSYGGGDSHYQENSVGRGSVHNRRNSNRTGSFSQENSSSRGNIGYQDSLARLALHHQENSISEGNYYNQGKAIGRGRSFNQENSIGRGNLIDQAKNVGRGSLVASRGSAEGQANPVGRGHFLMKLAEQQSSQCRDDQIRKQGPCTTTNHYSNTDNFRD